METFVKKVDELIQVGWDIIDSDKYLEWYNRVFAFLGSAIDENVAEKFASLKEDKPFYWERYRTAQIGYLEGLTLSVESKGLSKEAKESSEKNYKETNQVKTKKVFVVHGHDSETKESVARFIEKLGL